MKKRIISLLLSFVLAITMLPVIVAEAAATYWTDEGNYDTAWYDNNPTATKYTLGSAEELAGLAVLVNNGNDFADITINIDNQIDLSAYQWTPIGNYSSVSDNNAFRGIFDGCNQIISGLTAKGDYSALFAYIDDGATICNLTLEDVVVSGEYYVAGLAAYADTGSGTVEIINCTAKVNILDKTTDNIDSDNFLDCQYTAGLIGYLNAEQGTAVVEHCENSGLVEFDCYGAGIVGYVKGNTANKVIIEDCHNYAFVDGNDNSEYGGGIAGYASYVQFVECGNYASVYGNPRSDDDGSLWNGGIAGAGGNLDFVDCANYGTISAWVVGGMTTSSTLGLTVKNCLNVGKMNHISEPDGRGYALIYSGKVENSYYLSGTGTAPKESQGAKSVSATQLASGEICYLLNGSTSEGELVWGQNLDNGETVQQHPYIGGAAVYKTDSGYSNSEYVEDENTASGTCGENINWSITDGVLTISGEGILTTDTVPWDKYRDEIVKVVIEDGITEFNGESFYNCSNLKELVIPATVEVITIHINAFAGCVSLEKFVVDDDNPYYQEIGGMLCNRKGNYLLMVPSSFVEVNVPDGILECNDYAFQNCTKLEKISLPETLTYINGYSFEKCTLLKSLVIPKNVDEITGCFFDIEELYILNEECRILDFYVEEDKEYTVYGYAESTVQAYIEEYNKTNENVHFVELTEENCPHLERYLEEIEATEPTCTEDGYSAGIKCPVCEKVMVAPEMVEAASGHCYLEPVFEWAEDYVSCITIFTCEECDVKTLIECEVTSERSEETDGIVKIEYSAVCEFEGEVYRNSQIIERENIIATGLCGDDLTWNLSFDGVLTIHGTGAMENYKRNDGMPWCDYRNQIKEVVIDEGVTSIGDYAFYGMTVMTDIGISETVTSIGAYAFKNAKALVNVNLPSGLVKLGESSFYACESLKSIEIPVSLWTIRSYTFKNCKSLETVIFNEGNLQKISDAAFYNTALKEVILPDCLDILDVYVFKNCDKLEKVTIGSSLTEIREASFYGTAIKSIVVPEGIKKIGAYAFKNCTKLTGMKLPETLTSVGEAAFYACSALEEVIFPDNVTTIGNYAFRKCSCLSGIEFGSGLESIGECAFYGCTDLAMLMIPENTETIGNYAFKGCTGLEEVSLSDNLQIIGESAFHTCIKLSEIVIPQNVKTVGAYCFSGSYNLWKIIFEGSAPIIGENAFNKLNVVAYYPGDDDTWTDEVRTDYGGTIKWKIK